jgi:hypothetical protein
LSLYADAAVPARFELVKYTDRAVARISTSALAVFVSFSDRT